MQIIKRPEFKSCECEICGTVFQIEELDKICGEYRRTYKGIEDITLYAVCPKCEYNRVKLTVKGEKWTEQN